MYYTNKVPFCRQPYSLVVPRVVDRRIVTQLAGPNPTAPDVYKRQGNGGSPSTFNLKSVRTAKNPNLQAKS